MKLYSLSLSTSIPEEIATGRSPLSKEKQDSPSALSYLFNDEIPGIVLIGSPGSGKSTLTQLISQVYRARLLGRLQDFEQDENTVEEYEKCSLRIPFRIILKDYAQWLSSQETPENFFFYLASQVSQRSGKNTTSEDLQNIIKSDATLFILDGLDEVPDKNLRQKMLDNIVTCIEQIQSVLNGDLKVIATTRPYGYSKEFDPSQYRHIELQPLEQVQAERYAQKWVEVREFSLNERQRI